MQLSPSEPFVPELPPQTMRAQQRKRFFGADQVWHTAILTPISAIYELLPCGEHLNGGWWPAKQWHDILACAVPQASAILDPLCALEPATRVLFLGLAGSLRGFTVGDVVAASSSVVDGGTHHPSWESSRYPSARAVTVRCVSESYARRDEFTSKADVVDMESGWVLAAARRHGRQSRAVLIVSDELHGRSYLDSELEAIATSAVAVAAHAARDAARG
jgi:uridine phosphorylase